MEKAELAQTEYQTQWPNYCQGCHGAGLHSWYENQSPIGSGMYWPEGLHEPCSDCAEKGNCPRCGQEISADDDAVNAWLEDQTPCPHCGWDWGQEGDVCPDIPDIPEYRCWWELEWEEVRRPSPADSCVVASAWALTLRDRNEN